MNRNSGAASLEQICIVPYNAMGEQILSFLIPLSSKMITRALIWSFFFFSVTSLIL